MALKGITIFDVAAYQAALKGTKRTAADKTKAKRVAKKSLSAFKDLEVVEINGRKFLRGKLKTSGELRYRILAKKDVNRVLKHTKQKAPKKVAAKAKPKKSPRKRRVTSPGRLSKARLNKMTKDQVLDEVRKRRPDDKVSELRRLRKNQLVNLVLTGKKGRAGSSPRGQSPKRRRRVTTPRKTTPKKKTPAKKKKTPARKKKTPAKRTRASPKRALLRGGKLKSLAKLRAFAEATGTRSAGTRKELEDRLYNKYTMDDLKKELRKFK